MTAARGAADVWRRAAAVVAVLFGLVTLVAGGRVLMGADPGYPVFRPLLIFNTAMGVAYVAAGLAMWRGLRGGMAAGRVILALNTIVFATVLGLHVVHAVAIESVRAMAFRTLFWLGLLMALVRLGRTARE